MRVALYARVSTIDQGQNPETQLFRLREVAKARGWDIFDEYIDFASGKDPNRPQLKRLMADAKQHRFDMVFITRIDRIMWVLSVVNRKSRLKERWGNSL